MQKYEKGISPIAVERLQQIAKALGIAPTDFLVNKFEEAVKERFTRYEPGAYSTHADPIIPVMPNPPLTHS